MNSAAGSTAVTQGADTCTFLFVCKAFVWLDTSTASATFFTVSHDVNICIHVSMYEHLQICIARLSCCIVCDNSSSPLLFCWGELECKRNWPAHLCLARKAPFDVTYCVGNVYFLITCAIATFHLFPLFGLELTGSSPSRSILTYSFPRLDQVDLGT